MSQDPATSWGAVKALFDAAAVLPGGEREALLAAADVTEAVRAEARSLLAHLDEAGEKWLAEVAASGAAPPPRATVGPGDRLGAWQIVRALGSGGMGEVFEARRADGSFEGRAAIKLLKRGMDSAAVLERFALERSALARLNHPHIAQLFDAGESDDGLPYFVMEYVDGQSIDRAARELPLEGRLRLFLQLTDAVAHAHRKLLVHRDLKPGNVLVNGEGQVKLLDFGIAKALDPAQGADASTAPTLLRPYTPLYASPEQVRGEAVSTATDIYSLGGLLYGLLTGTRPYGRDATSAHEAARCVLEEEATRPSELSPQQVADPQWLATRKRLRGDLDNILLKALDKVIDRRYVSVDALAADLRAYLGGYPVSAQAPRWAYRTRKFVSRNRWGVAVGAVALAALIGGTALALWQANIANKQRELAVERFRQVRQLANQLVFKYHDQIETLPGATKTREALLVDAALFLDNLDQAATDDPTLAEELARTYYRIAQLQGADTSINTGNFSLAEINLNKALALTPRYVERADTPIKALSAAISMHVSRGELWQRSGRMQQADAALREAVPILERALQRAPNDNWALAGAITLHGVHARILGSNLALATLGRWRDACVSADRARAAAEATIAADPKNNYAPDSLAFTLGEQAQCRLLAAKSEEANALFTRQIGLRDQMAAKFPDDIDFRYQRSISRGNLAWVLSVQGQHGPALLMLERAITLAREAADADPGNQAGGARLDALQAARLPLLVAAGDRAAARAQADAVLRRLQPAPVSTPAPGFGRIRARADALIWAARAWREEQPRQALAFAQEAAALMQPAAPDDDNVSRRWWLALALGEQALALVRSGEAAGAAEAARAALALWQLRPPEEGPPPALQQWIEPVRALLPK